MLIKKKALRNHAIHTHTRVFCAQKNIIFLYPCERNYIYDKIARVTLSLSSSHLRRSLCWCLLPRPSISPSSLSRLYVCV